MEFYSKISNFKNTFGLQNIIKSELYYLITTKEAAKERRDENKAIVVKK